MINHKTCLVCQSLVGIYTRIDNKVTFAILTKEASPLFVKIHNKKNRQPLILDDEHEKEWLENDLDQDDIQKLLNYSYDQTQLEYHPFSSYLFHPKVNSDVESTLDRVEYEGLEIWVANSQSTVSPTAKKRIFRTPLVMPLQSRWYLLLINQMCNINLD